MNQKLVLDRWALGHDFDILSYFEDSSVSGRIPAIRRRGFKDMLEIIKSDSVDAILVYELSRVGRTFWDTLDAIKAIEEYAPVDFLFTAGNFSTEYRTQCQEVDDRHTHMGS